MTDSNLCRQNDSCPNFTKDVRIMQEMSNLVLIIEFVVRSKGFVLYTRTSHIIVSDLVVNQTKFFVVSFCSLFGLDRAQNTIVVY